MLFRYLKITYQLPSDTTVRNQLAHIFQELLGKVVREFAVSIFLESTIMVLILLPGSQIQDCLCHRYVDHTPGVYVCMLDRVFHQRRLGNHRARDHSRGQRA